MSPPPSNTLLRVRDLETSFATEEGLVRAVDGVSFRIGRGETFALVGESGCGKSVTAMSLLKLVPSPPGRVAAAAISLDGRDILSLREPEMRSVRGGQIAMIFQEPMTSLNPVFTCGGQIVEAIQLHRSLSGREAKSLAIDMLAKVGIPEPAQRFGEYPHQMSGGMRQRVMIAMALSCNPQLLIADEPTTALDVTIQAQILDLLRELQEAEGLSILMITHDLAVVAETAHTVAVMYASKMVEYAEVHDLFARPLHPYTVGLFQAVPRLGRTRERMSTIEGAVPDPLAFPSGCKFHPRCSLTRERAAEAPDAEVQYLTLAGEPARVMKCCVQHEPALREVRPGHCAACWLAPGYDRARATNPADLPGAAPGREDRP